MSDVAAGDHSKNGGKKSKAKAAKEEPPAEAAPVKLPGFSIHDVSMMTVEKAKQFFDRLRLTEEGTKIAEPLVREVIARLGFMFDVGLGYLTLDRKTATLSAQRRGA